MAQPDRPLLYVCYAPADEGWVHGRMLPALGLAQAQYCTRADDRLGEPQLTEIVKAIEGCLVTVVIASSASRWDPLLEHVASLALHAAIEAGEPRFLVATRDVPLESLSLDKRALVGLDCSDEEKTVQSLERLRKRLDLRAPLFERPPCPYPGLHPFTKANRHLLFGRDDDKDEILQRIRAGHSKILLYGPSGTGKSSLVHSAVLPALPSQDYFYKVVESGGRPVSALRAAIRALALPGADAVLTKYLKAARGATDAELERARGVLDEIRVPDPRRRILVVDPLEEIFAEENTTWRTLFFHLLAALWSRPWCTVILCMRADFLGMLMSERCWRELDGSQRPVPPLQEAGLRAAIVMPARHEGVHVEEALVERLIREADLDRSPVPLPLLQVALEELWARLRWRYLTLASYEGIVRKGPWFSADDTQSSSGEASSRRARRGLSAVLAVHADRILQTLTEPGDREIAKHIFLDLIHLGEGRPHTRRRRTLRQLQRRDAPPEQLHRVLKKLVAGRLITTDVGEPAPGAERHFDLAHDALIDGWEVLATWVKEQRGELIRQRQLEAWVQKWLEDRSTRPPSRVPRWIPLLLLAAVIVASGSLLHFTKPRPISACERAARSHPEEAVVKLCINSYEATRDSQELRWAAEAALAIGDLERAGKLARQLSDGPSYIDGFRVLSEVDLRVHPADAETAWQSASITFAASRAAGDERRMTSAAGLISQAARQLGDFAAALDAADRAVLIAERLRDPGVEMTAHLWRAEALRRIGYAEGAEAALRRARERAVSTCDKAWTYFTTGMLQLDTDHGGKARLSLNAVEDANRECRHPTLATAIELAMAWLMRETDPAGALSKLNAISKPEDDRDLESLLLRGYLAADRGFLDEADVYLVRAEAVEAPDPDLLWKVAQARAELADLRGGPFADLLAEYHYLRSIAMVTALRDRARAWSAYLVSSHRGPFDGLISLRARAGRWRDVLAVIAELDASDMLRAAAAVRDRTLLDLTLPHTSSNPVVSPPVAIEVVLTAWRSRDLVVVIAPSRRQIGRGREHAYRLRIASGQVSGEDVGDASLVRKWAEDLFSDPDDKDAARALGHIVVPLDVMIDIAPETLDVLGVGVLGKVPLAALRDEAGAPIVGRRPLARVLSLRPSPRRSVSPAAPVVIADPLGDLFGATLEGYFVASELGARAQLAGGFTSISATRAELWKASRSELLHFAGPNGEQGRWRTLRLQDGDVTPDEIVQRGLAPHLAVIAGGGSAVSHDEEGWDSLAAALLEAGTSMVIATSRSLGDATLLSLMRAFYAQPDWHTDPVGALARMQAGMARATNPPMPAREWAAFTVLRRPPSLD
jgi:tetratricopeptide (TPR) repeat protein